MKSRQPLACVLGDMDLVRPLGLSGVDCVVAVPPGAAPRFSRFTRAALEWANPWEHGDKLVETLMQFGTAQAKKPVLFYESDGELLLISRNRERLRQAFRFVIADPTLVEDLVDKELFQKLAERLSLPVPPARRLRPDQELKPADLGLRYPIVVKPLTRRPDVWKAVAKSGKAVRVNTPEELLKLWPRLAASGVTTLAQELIPGPETCIESYHVYVDEQGEIVGEFTGRKIRTYPREYGDSTALVTTNETDVVELGRQLVHQLRLQGVAKFDFKRAPDGKLYLLEVNPRFNLWHHLGALAGVNLPALVYSDLTGQPRPAVTTARSNMRWCRIWQDAQAARASQLSLAKWLPWALGCEAQRLLSWDDPMPFLGAALFRAREWQQSLFTKTESQRFSRQVSAAKVPERTRRPEMTINNEGFKA